MSEMIERIAAALYAEANKDPHGGSYIGSYQRPAPHGRFTCLDGDFDLEAFARAAIEASGLLEILRECIAVADSGESDIRGLPWDKIDAALKGP